MDNTSINWKEIAIKRRLENKELKKRIKEVKISRDTWKEKASNIKTEKEILEKTLTRIKKKLETVTKQLLT